MKILMLLVLAGMSTQAMASTQASRRTTQNYLTIRSVEYKDLTNEYRLKDSHQLTAIQSIAPTAKILPAGLGSISAAINTMAVDQAELIVDKIINIGQKIWTVVDKGRPVQNFQNSVASALPANANSWTDLISWKQPESRVIGISCKNLYGAEVVHFVYRIILLSGGTVNGVGNYIGYAAVEPVEMTTSYMYTFNSQAVVVNIFNKGTHQNPLAGMILTVRWSIETVLKKSVGSETFFLDGTGNIDVAEKTSLK